MIRCHARGEAPGEGADVLGIGDWAGESKFVKWQQRLACSHHRSEIVYETLAVERKVLLRSLGIFQLVGFFFGKLKGNGILYSSKASHIDQISYSFQSARTHG